MKLGDTRFDVELAMDDESRARGLMYRESMDNDKGMLFIFDRAEPQVFWMKNTYIPLDILYFDADRKLVAASLRASPCRGSGRCPGYPSEKAAKYVLEINAGLAENYGFKLGQSLEVSPAIEPSM